MCMYITGGTLIQVTFSDTLCTYQKICTYQKNTWIYKSNTRTSSAHTDTLTDKKHPAIHQQHAISYPSISFNHNLTICSFSQTRGPDDAYHISSYRVLITPPTPNTPRLHAPYQRTSLADEDAPVQAAINAEQQEASVINNYGPAHEGPTSPPELAIAEDNSILTVLFATLSMGFDGDAWSPKHPEHVSRVDMIWDMGPTPRSRP